MNRAARQSYRLRNRDLSQVRGAAATTGQLVQSLPRTFLPGVRCLLRVGRLERLKLLSAAIVAAVPFFFLTPFFHRLGDAAASTYLVFHLTNSFLVFSVIVGTAAGVHYWLLAAGALVVFYGTRRIVLALLMVCCLAGLFLLVEFRLPRFSEYAPISPAFAAVMKSLAVVGEALIVAGFVYLALRMAEAAESELEREYDRSENLLLNLMPTSIAARLKEHPDAIIADQFDAVTILFADIVDFTPRAGRLAPDELVRFLNRVFSEFDNLAEKHGLEKIKTIGDAYMVAGGMPETREGHATAIADMALEMLAVTARLATEFHEELTVRIGIHTGPAVAGVIGTRKLFYDVWGDTVNTASRMESHGSAGRIQVTDEAKLAIGHSFVFERRGTVEIKGRANAPPAATIARPKTSSRAMLFLACAVRHVVEETARNDLAAIAFRQFGTNCGCACHPNCCSC